ncbi:MAG: aminotransferase class I/II-fold pyridoxal phosphate-dependent enzyme [Synergistaceae bacterium]|nr:aminotransferase class I/II-fold pyridoxal phosphate-dependent enzyme [Synergistaceae bacterium]
MKFETDYQEGAHPRILERLIQTNNEQTSGYGEDIHTERAKELIRKVIHRPESEVFFMTGGTQTNMTVIKFLLSPVEGVIAVSSGHINVHESGAIESTGHKVLSIEGKDGLIDPEGLNRYLEAFTEDTNYDHIVHPGMVYVSYSSELGTIYTRESLTRIKSICDKYNMKLFIDGARLGAGLTSEKCNMTIEDIAGLCDVFYIGGTKNGALFGEAVVFPDKKRFDLRNFRTLIKQQGGLLAKGRMLGIQFEVLFEDGLYFENSRHANIQAMKIKRALTEANIPMLIDSYTNQQFPILTHEQNERLNEKFSYELWQPLNDGRCAYRFCTSWLTTDEATEELTNAIKII